jgi:hypothetical protein
MNDIQRDYWMMLFSNLVNASPVDTRNMVTHIRLFETPNTYEIMIEAPYSTNPKSKTTNYKGKSDYAEEVNYASKSPHQYWVEKQIKLTEKIIDGRSNLNV